MSMGGWRHLLNALEIVKREFLQITVLIKLDLLGDRRKKKEALSPQPDEAEDRKKSPRSRSPFAKFFSSRDKGQKTTPTASPQISSRTEESPSLRTSGWSLGYFTTTCLHSQGWLYMEFGPQAYNIDRCFSTVIMFFHYYTVVVYYFWCILCFEIIPCSCVLFACLLRHIFKIVCLTKAISSVARIIPDCMQLCVCIFLYVACISVLCYFFFHVLHFYSSTFKKVRIVQA